MKKLVFGIFTIVGITSLSYGQNTDLKNFLKAEKEIINIRIVENNDDINISFKNDLKEFPSFNMKERFEINYFENKNKVYSFRQVDYNNNNAINFSVFFIFDENNKLIEEYVQKDTTLDDSSKLLNYYYFDDNLADSFIYESTTNTFKSQTENSAKVGGRCVKACVEAIYDYNTYAGIILIGISAAQPETFIAVLAGCTIGCRH